MGKQQGPVAVALGEQESGPRRRTATNLDEKLLSFWPEAPRKAVWGSQDRQRVRGDLQKGQRWQTPNSGYKLCLRVWLTSEAHTLAAS